MPDSHPLERQLAASWPPQAWQDVTVLVAVSGGADSVALLRAMAALKTTGEGRLHAAHLNHHLRSEESDADEAFVVELCRRCGVDCEVGEIPPGRARGRLRRRSGSGLSGGALRVSAADGRPAWRTLRRHRPYGRRPGRDHSAPDRSRDRHWRPGRHASCPAAGRRGNLDPAHAGHPPRGTAGLSRRARATLLPRRHQRGSPLHAKPHPPRVVAPVGPAVQLRRGRGLAAAGNVGRRGPGRRRCTGCRPGRAVRGCRAWRRREDRCRRLWPRKRHRTT